ncbi:MAG TPA: hypothetical protein PLG17_03965 [Thermodesulfobacteriota bacterium]|mgnify:CR=1 FL=1|nr:hypothetical protein [Deltaproteobacteria bacterium]HNR12079.1 hypothetical protein [Thermodesulfobacteriota bacterium]HNU70269.1 hypothetical protein [Thermodesulfobacteriota bacterium]HOC39178.1 hypothetical protein [Thermodesulfobacteriota bacterium]HQO77648.1 hypothetical protein [Thermodesulfobacteriota bacterium]
MQPSQRVLFLLFISCWLAGTVGYALDPEALITLKRAGVRDDTIQVLVQEKALETSAFTVQEIVSLKQAGLSDETIQIVVREGSFMKNREPVVYGKEIQPLKFATVNDIIELKQAGLSDEVIKALIVCGSEDRSDQERQQAWDMLDSMGLIIDLEKHHH